MLDAVRSLVSTARQWVDGTTVVDSAALDRLATLAGVEPQRFDESPTLLVCPPASDHLPLPHQIERVRFQGWLAAHQATLWCRRESPVLTSSPVPWPDRRWPWVVEIHLRTPDLDDGSKDGSTAFGVPCPVDPREPSPEADAAIALVVARAMLHEGQESIVGLPLDPHAMGETGLHEVAAHIGAACW